MEKRSLYNTASLTKVGAGKKKLKLETLFWYVTTLFEMQGQWHNYWKCLVTRKVWYAVFSWWLEKNSSTSKEISIFEWSLNILVLLVKNDYAQDYVNILMGGVGNSIQSKTDPDYRTHTLRETILFVFSKIYTVIVFVLLSCLLCLSKEVIRILKCKEDN